MKNTNLTYIGYALEDINIWDMTVEEIQDTIYKMYYNDKTKWLFDNIDDYKELDNLVVQYLKECTNYFEPVEE